MKEKRVPGYLKPTVASMAKQRSLMKKEEKVKKELEKEMKEETSPMKKTKASAIPVMVN